MSKKSLDCKKMGWAGKLFQHLLWAGEPIQSYLRKKLSLYQSDEAHLYIKNHFWYSYYQYKLSNFSYRNLKSKHALSQVKHVNPSGVNQPRNKNILYTKRQTLFCIFHCAASKIIVHDLLLFVNQSFISLWMFTVSIDLSFKWAPR